MGGLSEKSPGYGIEEQTADIYARGCSERLASAPSIARQPSAQGRSGCILGPLGDGSLSTDGTGLRILRSEALPCYLPPRKRGESSHGRAPLQRMLR